MKARSARLAVQALDNRIVPSAVAYGDFNNDGRLDMAAITGNKTITVSLANLAGGYSVSATLTAPKPINSVSALNVINVDGKLDIAASGNSGEVFRWQGNGDGTFVYIQPWSPPKHTHGGTW